MKGEPIEPSTAFAYISRSFRQTVPHIVGAMRLVANTYTPDELNKKGFALYAEFRPEVDGWGKRAEVTCKRILSMRKATPTCAPPKSNDELSAVGTSKQAEEAETTSVTEAPQTKRVKTMTLEEYEKMLDDSALYDSLNFDFDEG